MESNQSISWMKENLIENVVSLKITIKNMWPKKSDWSPEVWSIKNFAAEPQCQQIGPSEQGVGWPSSVGKSRPIWPLKIMALPARKWKFGKGT